MSDAAAVEAYARDALGVECEVVAEPAGPWWLSDRSKEDE